MWGKNRPCRKVIKSQDVVIVIHPTGSKNLQDIKK